MPDPRPLPTLIGTTENALRALLVRLVAVTPIQSYERWVAMNILARSVRSRDDIKHALADALKIDEDRVDGLLADLEAEHLIDDSAVGVQLSTAGAVVIGEALPLVGGVTKRLVDGVAPSKLEIVLQVLDEVRSNAERELANLT